MRMTVGVLVVVAMMMVVGGAGGAAAETATERRLRLLEEKLGEAQQEIKRLKSEMRTMGQTTQQQLTKAEEQGKAAATKSDIPEWTKRTSVFGDLRVRQEGFYNQPEEEGDSVHARNRTRIRARVGLKSTFTDELSATIRIATGNNNDPISTNETLTNSFTRKNIGLDWAYLTLTPGQTFGIRPGLATIYAGKFPNPLFRPGAREMIYDDDLSPEGFSETINVLAKPVGPLQRLNLHALQWTFGEVSNDHDGWMFGGQVAPSFQVGKAQIDAGIGQYGWINEDLIAQQATSNSQLNVTNLTTTRVVDGDTVEGFVSEFQETNPSLQVTFPNVIGTAPLQFWGDYVHNWGAESDDNDGYQLGWRLGNPKVRGDWSVYALWERLETDAVLSMFSWSDFGTGGTNKQGGSVGVDYQLLNPLTLSARTIMTNYINRPEGTSNPTLFRFQLDALMKF